MTTYDEVLDYLLDYVDADWLGFSVLVGSAGSVLGRGAARAQYEELVLRFVADLLRHGAVLGDLVEGDRSFVPWSGTPAQVLDRVRSEMAALGELPDSGQVGWLTREAH